MTVGELKKMLQNVPDHLDLAICTPDIEHPDDLEWGDLWSIVPEDCISGTEGIILAARRHVLHGG